MITNKDKLALLALARRTLWIANCWNDHNFRNPHEYAKEEAKKYGLDDFENANFWIEKMNKELAK